MKIVWFLLLSVAPAVADLTPAGRADLLDLTKDLIEEKTDEFDKEVVVAYSGPDVNLNADCELSAWAVWPEGKINDVTFHLTVTRVADDWRWLEFSKTQMLADGELVSLIPARLTTDVFDGGKVYEAQRVVLTLEQVLRITAAETVKMRVGIDEWTWMDKHKVPLQLVFSRWLGRGGDPSKYKDLLKLILRPSAGTSFADVVNRYGEPSQRNPQSGWALWPGFWARFKDGKVIETKVDRDTKKAAQ